MADQENFYKNTAEHFDCKSKIYVDKGYYGINKYHNKVLIPKKNKKKIPLNKNELKQNQKINKIRIRIEHVFGVLKRYKILSTRYRNHLQKLNTRFFILASICNYQLKMTFETSIIKIEICMPIMILTNKRYNNLIN